MTSPSEEAVLKAFEMIERAAVRGERCPLDGDGAVSHRTVNELARRGWLLVHRRNKNWREACLLIGNHAGKWTRRCPDGGRVFHINDLRGPRRPLRGESLQPRIYFTDLSLSTHTPCGPGETRAEV